MLYVELSGTVIGAAMEVHKLLGSGFLESACERALAWGLTVQQKPLERQAPITAMDKQAQIGEYRADFLVGSKILPEIKATTALIAGHHAKALHYLTATGLRLALLLNFGTRPLQFKRLIRQAFGIRGVFVF